MLEIDGVSKRFGSTVALDGMTLTVRPGELYGFVGANGAGKTTTMRIALGVLAADAGEVRLDGRPLDAASRRRIGYMPEERGLYPRMAVGTQLRYLAELRGRSAADARAAADRWTERLGIADRRGDEVQRLSLGNQQRVQLAAALVADPDVLVLDEPFSGLDPLAVDVMSEVAARAPRRRRAGGLLVPPARARRAALRPRRHRPRRARRRRGHRGGAARRLGPRAPRRRAGRPARLGRRPARRRRARAPRTRARWRRSPTPPTPR